MSIPLLAPSFGFWNFVGSDHTHGTLGDFFINDNDEAAIGNVSPNGWETGGLAGSFVGRAPQHVPHVFNGEIVFGDMFNVAVRLFSSSQMMLQNSMAIPRRIIANWVLVVNWL